jgi:hypothetical protein
MQLSPSWEGASHSATQEFLNIPVSSLPCSQEPSSGTYPELDQCSPHHPILSLYNPFQHYLLNYILDFLVFSFLLVYPPKSYLRSSSPHFRVTCTANLIIGLVILIIFLWHFVTILFFMFRSCQPQTKPSKLVVHPLSSIHDCLFNIFASSLHI